VGNGVRAALPGVAPDNHLILAVTNLTFSLIKDRKPSERRSNPFVLIGKPVSGKVSDMEENIIEPLPEAH
jgi:hypothetical protein